LLGNALIVRIVLGELIDIPLQEPWLGVDQYRPHPVVNSNESSVVARPRNPVHKSKPGSTRGDVHSDRIGADEIQRNELNRYGKWIRRVVALLDGLTIQIAN